MKEFNLEEAKFGNPVCTKEGNPVRILCFDRLFDEYCIVGLIKVAENREKVGSWNKKGKALYSTNDDDNLMMVDLNEDNESCVSDDFIEKLADKIISKMYPTKPWTYPNDITFPEYPPRIVMYGVTPTTFSTITDNANKRDPEDKSSEWATTIGDVR